MSLVIEHVTNRVGKLLWTAKVHTSGGRENGAAKSSDGQLDIKLSLPGSKRPGTNPEQLLAAGWSACFEGAIAATVKKMRLTLPADPVIDAEVDLSSGEAEGYFFACHTILSSRSKYSGWCGSKLTAVGEYLFSPEERQGLGEFADGREERAVNGPEPSRDRRPPTRARRRPPDRRPRRKSGRLPPGRRPAPPRAPVAVGISSCGCGAYLARSWSSALNQFSMWYTRTILPSLRCTAE
jgi:lipoyl-dependent peroxiredoxin